MHFAKITTAIWKVPKWVLSILLILLAVRAVLPSACLYYVNHALDTKLENYIGHLDDFDLNIYRGAYQLQGLEIRKRNSELPPMIKVEEIDIALAWRALINVWL